MTRKWAAKFKRSEESLEDDPRVGRPSKFTTQVKGDKIHDTATGDQRVTKPYITTDLDISKERFWDNN